MVCSLYHPKTIIMDSDTMEPIDITKIPAKDFAVKCSMCSFKGACVKCLMNCKNYFHITCAQKHASLREIVKEDRISFRGLCLKHAKVRRRTLTSTIKTVGASSKKKRKCQISQGEQRRLDSGKLYFDYVYTYQFHLQRVKLIQINRKSLNCELGLQY